MAAQRFVRRAPDSADRQEDTFLFCDSCDRGWDLKCLDPPLSAIPRGPLFFWRAVP